MPDLPFYAGFYDKAVHHDFNGMMLLFFKANVLSKLHHLSIYPGSNKTVCPHLLQFFFIFTFSSPYKWYEHLDSCAFGKHRYRGYNIADILRGNYSAAAETDGYADAAVQYA